MQLSVYFQRGFFYGYGMGIGFCLVFIIIALVFELLDIIL